MFLYYLWIQELPELLCSLQSDLVRSREEANACQLKLEEYQITDKIKQEVETEEAEVSTYRI